MRTKAVLLSTVLAFAGAMALAQQRPSTNSSGQTGATSSTTEQTATSTTVQGCLTGTTGNYMLADQSGMMYEVRGDDSQLSANVNKEVEATGTIGTRASASATNNPDTSAPSSAQQGEASASAGNATGTASGGTATAHASKTLEVTSIRKLSDTCSSSR